MRGTPYIRIVVLIAFLANNIGLASLLQAQEFRLPAPGVMVGLSPEYKPPILKGIKVHTDNPLKFDFILDQGDSPNSAQTLRLIKYFLASLTIPEKDLWVNLSPYEKDHIIPATFGRTEMGRDLLSEDYMLKQISASLIYPEGEVGKRFWEHVYQEAGKKFGTTNIPVNTFNKVWIIPQKATVYENVKAGTAYIINSKLKVMLEEDYLALEKNSIIQKDSVILNAVKDLNKINSLGSKIVREIVIPELTKEVNQDKNFAQLRQVYNSLILATWYKNKIRDSVLARVYADKNKVAGVGYNSPSNIEFIYQRYIQAFKKGVFNYIKDTDTPHGMSLPRKYFSGGFDAERIAVTIDSAQVSEVPAQLFGAKIVTVNCAIADQVWQKAAYERLGSHLEFFPDSQMLKLDGVPLKLMGSENRSSIFELDDKTVIRVYEDTSYAYKKQFELLAGLNIGPGVIIDGKTINNFSYLVVEKINGESLDRINRPLSKEEINKVLGLIAKLFKDHIFDKNFWTTSIMLAEKQAYLVDAKYAYKADYYSAQELARKYRFILTSGVGDNYHWLNIDPQRSVLDYLNRVINGGGFEIESNAAMAVKAAKRHIEDYLKIYGDAKTNSHFVKISSLPFDDKVFFLLAQYVQVPGIKLIIEGLAGTEENIAGSIGELYHASWLENKDEGFHVLAFGVSKKRGKKGDTDILASRGGQIYFVEVKNQLADALLSKKNKPSTWVWKKFLSTNNGSSKFDQYTDLVKMASSRGLRKDFEEQIGVELTNQLMGQLIRPIRIVYSISLRFSGERSSGARLVGIHHLINKIVKQAGEESGFDVEVIFQEGESNGKTNLPGSYMAQAMISTPREMVVLNQVQGPYQYKDRTLNLDYVYPGEVKPEVMVKEELIHIVFEEIRHFAQDWQLPVNSIDPHKVIFQIAGSVSYLIDSDNRVYWPGVDDLDVFVYVPDSIYRAGLYKDDLKDRIEKRLKHIMPKPCQVVILSKEGLFSQGHNQMETPYRPDNIYIGDRHEIEMMELVAEISPQHKIAVLKEYSDLFKKYKEIPEYANKLKILFRLAQMRGDRVSQEALFGLIEKFINGNSWVENLSTYADKATPDWDNSQLSIALEPKAISDEKNVDVLNVNQAMLVPTSNQLIATLDQKAFGKQRLNVGELEKIEGSFMGLIRGSNQPLGNNTLADQVTGLKLGAVYLNRILFDIDGRIEVGHHRSTRIRVQVDCRTRAITAFIIGDAEVGDDLADFRKQYGKQFWAAWLVWVDEFLDNGLQTATTKLNPDRPNAVKFFDSLVQAWAHQGSSSLEGDLINGSGKVGIKLQGLDWNKIRHSIYEPASVSKAMSSNVGGIDLTSANKYLQTQNNGGEIKFHMDSAMLEQLRHASGFVPVIINVQPLIDLKSFLGIVNQS